MLHANQTGTSYNSIDNFTLLISDTLPLDSNLTLSPLHYVLPQRQLQPTLRDLPRPPDLYHIATFSIHQPNPTPLPPCHYAPTTPQ